MKGTLNRLPSWELDSKDRDIRGWPLLDTEGHALGKVQELIVDTNEKHVSGIVLDDGKQYPAHDVMIGNHVLTLTNGSLLAARKNTLAGAAAATGLGAAAVGARDLKREYKAPIPAPTFKRPDLEGDVILPLVDEELSVGKRTVDAGGVRVQTHTVSKPIEKQVTLREERVKIDRRPIDRQLDLAEADAKLRDETIEVVAKSEVPFVAKSAHIVEEVVVHKEATERIETIRDSVRHTEAEISELPKRKERS